MKRKSLMLGMALLALCGCASSEGDIVLAQLEPVHTLESPEIVYEFDDRYPVAVSVKDSLIYIIHAKEDTCMQVLNVNSSEILSSFGAKGHSEKDLVNPNFILSTSREDVLLDVGNLRKLMKAECVGGEVLLSQYMPYPDELFPSSELNISENYMVGRKVGLQEESMFYIFHKKTKGICHLPYYPELTSEVKDKNYAYAPVLALNEQRGRVIAGLYFFDVFHVYDLSGKRLRSVCLSEDYKPSVNKDMRAVDLQSGYSGTVRTFSTDEHCYLLRLTMGKDFSDQRVMLIETDWDGEITHAYSFQDDVDGQFFVDEVARKLYIIKRDIRDDNEIFSIVIYRLP